MPSPNVLWSQTMASVNLSVQLSEVKKDSVNLILEKDGLLKFKAIGNGGSGRKQYEFAIPLDPEIFNAVPKVKYFSSRLEIKLAKKNTVMGPLN